MSRKKRVSLRKIKKSTVKKPSKSPLIFSTLLVVVVTFVITITIIKVSEFIISQQDHNFPKLEIFLNSITVEELDLSNEGTVFTNNTANFAINNKTISDKNIQIKTRGNSTWNTPKKPYQIKLASKSTFFNLAPAKKWILLANYLDPSYLRTDIAYYLEKIFGEDYAIDGDFIDLYIDNSYRGLYYLSEKVEINKSRITLHNSSAIIAEIDNLHSIPENCHYADNGDCLIVHDLIDADSEEKTITDFTDTYNSLVTAISEKDYLLVSEIIDVDSFARYFLLNEFTANPDAYSSSFFLYQDGKDGKIYAGPGWDFDFSFGNEHWGADGINSLSPYTNLMFRDYIIDGKTISTDPHITSVSTLIYNLLDLSEFSTRAKEIYQSTLSGHGEELLTHIKDQANYIRPAALRDQARWKLKTDFDEEVDYLIDWVAKRYEHFEEIYGATPDPAPESPQP